MKILTPIQSAQVSGGSVVLHTDDDGILTSEGDKLVYKGMAFTSDGRLFGSYTGTVYHNFSVDPNPACIFGYQFVATPIEGGFSYISPGKCSLFG